LTDSSLPWPSGVTRNRSATPRWNVAGRVPGRSLSLARVAAATFSLVCAHVLIFCAVASGGAGRRSVANPHQSPTLLTEH
jgi:hypothetical protein